MKLENSKLHTAFWSRRLRDTEAEECERKRKISLLIILDGYNLHQSLQTDDTLLDRPFIAQAGILHNVIM